MLRPCMNNLVDHLFRLYSACILLSVFLYRSENIGWSINLAFILGLLYLLIWSLQNVFGELILSFISNGLADELYSHTKFKFFDKFLISTALPVLLIFALQLIKIVNVGEGDPDNTCMGMRDVGC
jgi:hypothetical protein